jgi:hypothetical protein
MAIASPTYSASFIIVLCLKQKHFYSDSDRYGLQQRFSFELFDLTFLGDFQ